MDPILGAFFADAGPAERASDQPEVLAFIRALTELGIEHSQIDIADFELFSHADLRALCDTFIAAHPFVPLPLERITLVHHDLAFLAEGVSANRAALEHVATRYNVEIRVHAFTSEFDAASTSRLAQFALTDAVDEIGLFFDFDTLDAGSAATLKGNLAALAEHPVLHHAKIRLGNFPACFFPEGAFKLAYRDAIAPLKGLIGSQRDVIREVGNHAGPYHDPCATCRARKACYTFSAVGDHPEIIDWLSPKTGDAVVFAGGSVAPYDVEHLVWTSPAEQGDILAAIFEGFDYLLLIDGYFRSRFPCTTFEVMTAIEQGIRVFGAASMGALRAAELDRFGMTGVGHVYETLRDSLIKPYHIVAQTYLEDNRALSPPLIELMALLRAAQADQVITVEDRNMLFQELFETHFMELSYKKLFDRCPALKPYYAAGNFQVKEQDAKGLIEMYREAPAVPPYAEIREQSIREVFSLYAGSPDLALPENWSGSGTSTAASLRGGRARSADETCERVGSMLQTIRVPVPVANTTQYDASGSIILSAFLIPFYFLDYYPSSATGNGEDFSEALASAYMELVERMPASGKHINERPLHDWGEHAFPAERLPQFANWNTDPRVKEYVTDLHGYVKVSDMLAAQDWVIPKSAIMFAYSGTDGYAAGNTLPEAVLYAIYELIERDACQMHVVDGGLRDNLQSFQLDPACLDEPSRKLLDQAKARNCRIILFSLPNLFGLPCIMCHVYDEAQGVQSHGGIAVRADFQSAAYSAIHEAAMQYITYYAGSRDDYTPFAPMKQARIAFNNAKAMYFDEKGDAPVPESFAMDALDDELQFVLERLRREGVENVLVADTSPLPQFELHSVKVIIPGLELWFVPNYKPSPGFDARVAELKRRWEMA